MFIRIKRINGTPYAYLVKNEWTSEGSRQKTAKYLGRIATLGDVETTFLPPQGSNGEYIRALIDALLKNAGFSADDEGNMVGHQITVNVDKMTVRRKNRPCVIEINEGFLCDMTLQNLLLFSKKQYAQELQDKQLHAGKVLAQRILEIGLQLTPEQFILTFDHLVPNSDVLLKYM